MTDFYTSFAAHPDTGQLIIRDGNVAVAQRIRNLVLTDPYEWPFEPTIGCGVRKLLFENFSPQTTSALQVEIEQTLNNHEPSISNVSVIVTAVELQNRYDVTVTYTVVKTQTQSSVSIQLSRIR